MIYLDSAAVVKLVHAEAESQALRDWLDERAETGWTSCALVEIESFRALARVCPGGDCPPGTAGLMPRRANLPAERLALPPSEQVLVQDGPGRRMRLGRDFYRIINVFG